MKVSVIQMDMRFGDPNYNFARAAELITKAVEKHPDVIVLPETWNTGFFPKENLASLCDQDASRVKREIGRLAKQLNVNIVAGSVSNMRDGKIYNTATVYDRQGNCLAEYDKTHLFTPMGEHDYFQLGARPAEPFLLDGVCCGLVICYDIRFPELIRTITLQGVEVFFMVSQWPNTRVSHINTLAEARAIENQMFMAYSNSCGTAGKVRYGGNSALIDPWGKVLCRAGEDEEILSAEFNLDIIKEIRQSINVFRDRRPALYNIS